MWQSVRFQRFRDNLQDYPNCVGTCNQGIISRMAWVAGLQLEHTWLTPFPTIEQILSILSIVVLRTPDIFSRCCVVHLHFLNVVDLVSRTYRHEAMLKFTLAESILKCSLTFIQWSSFRFPADIRYACIWNHDLPTSSNSSMLFGFREIPLLDVRSIPAVALYLLRASVQRDRKAALSKELSSKLAAIISSLRSFVAFVSMAWNDFLDVLVIAVFLG